MELIQIDSKEKYETFFSHQSLANLLQSWGWRQVLEGEGKEPKTFFIREKDKIVASVLVAKYYVPGGFYYLYSPRGPVFADGLSEAKKIKILKFISMSLRAQRSNLNKETARPSARSDDKALFWRIDPELTLNKNTTAVGKLFKDFKKADKEMQPKATQILDLTKTEKELLEGMKQKTRYNVRLAGKRGVRIREADSEKDLDVFYNLLVETADRDDFYLHEKKHYLNLWKNLYPENLRLYLAEIPPFRIRGGKRELENNNPSQPPLTLRGGVVIAGIMVGEYNGKAIYLHGASDYEHRSSMAPYLLQWYAARQAKERGNKTYDLHGVAPKSARQDHPWSGLTRFKQGFGGKYAEYIGTWDYVYRPVMYKIFNLARKLKV